MRSAGWGRSRWAGIGAHFGRNMQRKSRERGPFQSEPITAAILLFASARIGAKKLTEAGFINSAGRQLKDGLCGGFLAGHEPITIELEKQHTDHKAAAFVAINERMIRYDACRVLGGKFNNVRAGVRDMIQWPSQSRLKQRGVPYAGQSLSKPLILLIVAWGVGHARAGSASRPRHCRATSPSRVWQPALPQSRMAGDPG